MAKPELGLKRVCVACGAKFYDLGRTPPVCPKCGAEQPPEQPRTRRAAPLPEEKKKRVLPVADADAEEAVVEDAEEAEDVADDDADLEDDDDDVADEIPIGTDEET